MMPATSALLAAVLPAGHAADLSQSSNPAVLAPVVVVATKSTRPIAEVAGSVTVVDAGDLADRLGVNIGDIVRYTPGISLPRSTTRFGWDGYNLRGIGGNRVAIEVDGIPVASHFSIGSYSNAGRDAVDVDLLRRVEVLYGPASTLYGSDALGGVVAYFTYDPADLAQAGKPYFAAATAYRGDEDSFSARLTGAWSGATLGGLVSMHRRSGDQRDASAGAATTEDTQRWDSESAFGKLTLNLSGASRLTATAETTTREGDTQLRSFLGTGRFRSTTALHGEDRQRRDRASVLYDFATAGLDGRILAYRQHTETGQRSVEERAASDLRRTRHFEFTQRTTGLEFNASSRHRTGAASHVLSYGVEIARTHTTELRDAAQTALDGNGHTNVVLGETFPVRDFPISRDLELGAYIHDEISFGRWTLIPALRFDDYRLQPRPDVVYREDNPGSAVVDIDESRVTPRLGLIRELPHGWSVFGQYAQGFRAPPFADANIGLDIPMFNIRALPNANLESETSDGLELGLRRFAADGEFSVTLHHTRYDNFIDSRAPLGPDPDTGVLLFQSRNLGKAKIYGAEVRYRQRLAADWTVNGALAWTRGTDETTGAPIDSIDPAELVLGIAYQPATWPLMAQLNFTLVEGQDRFADTDDGLAGTPGFGVVDLSARYRLRGATVRAAIFNAFDNTHWRWGSVRGLAADDPTRPLLSEPGRHAGLSVIFEW